MQSSVFFFIVFCMEYIFHPLIFHLCMYSDLKWVSCRQDIYIYTHMSCFCIHSAILYLLVEAFSPFKFKVLIDTYVLIATLLTVLGLFCSFCLFLPLFFFFVIWWLYLILCLDSFFFLYLCIYFKFSVCDYNVTHVTI